MDDIANLINKRAKQLTVEGKRDELQIIQDEVDRFFDHGVKASKIYKDKNLLVVVDSSSLANQVFLQQIAIIKSINSALPDEIEGIRTKVVN